MITVVLVVLTVQASAPQPSEPRLDATSQDALDRTMKLATAALPPTQRGKFEEAVGILIGDHIDKHPNEPPEARLLAVFHGRTASELLEDAEALVKRLIDAESERKQAITSRALPPATVVDASSLACEALVSTTISPSQLAPADFFQISDSSFRKPKAEIEGLVHARTLEASSSVGTDRLAIEVRSDGLHFVTRAAVESGIAFAPPFRIVKNDSNALAAVDLQEGSLGFTLSTFLLNKQNGLAVWTKSRPSFAIRQEPDTQAHYLLCR